MALDMTTLTIMRQLPREVDPLVHNMSTEDPGDISYSAVGGLGEQIRELCEVSWHHPVGVVSTVFTGHCGMYMYIIHAMVVRRGVVFWFPR